MNGNMNLGKRVTALEKDGGADIKKEISDLQVAVTEMQTSVSTAQEEINNLENKVNSGYVYSTEEKVVGVWTDGKQLYQKNVKGKINVQEKTTSTVLTDDNIDSLVSCTGYVRYEENDVVLIPSAYFIPRLKKPNVAIQCLQTGATSRERDFEIIIFYTKTTDNPTQ